MTWGKLFGATAFVWYGAALCVPAWMIGPEATVRGLIELLVGGLFTQAAALLASLLLLRSRPEFLRFRVTLAQILALLAGAAFAIPALGDPEAVVTWFGRAWAAGDFLLATQVLFLAWAVAGSYRLMRTELQFPPGLLPWLLFVLFLAGFAGGFDYAEVPDLMLAAAGLPPVRWLAACLAAVVATYAAALLEPKSVVALRRWRRALAERRFGAAFGLTPRWAAAFLVAGGLAATVGTWPGSAAVLRPFLAAVLLFLARDIAVIHLLTLDVRPRRGSLGVLVYLAALYAACPQVARLPGLHGIGTPFLSLFLPLPDAGWPGVAGPAVEAALVMALLLWRRRSRPI
jgi:hypothetical protein